MFLGTCLVHNRTGGVRKVVVVQYFTKIKTSWRLKNSTKKIMNYLRRRPRAYKISLVSRQSIWTKFRRPPLLTSWLFGPLRCLTLLWSKPRPVGTCLHLLASVFTLQIMQNFCSFTSSLISGYINEFCRNFMLSDGPYPKKYIINQLALIWWSWAGSPESCNAFIVQIYIFQIFLSSQI